MNESPIRIERLPQLERPMLIAGFGGWGNALNVSTGMAAYLRRHFKARRFADLRPDFFYRYDENRPETVIENGRLRRCSPPGGRFYWATTPSGGRDLVILEADEPTLAWRLFAKAVFSLCGRLEIDTLVTLGSMRDNVFHWDRIISGVASSSQSLARFRGKKVVPADYEGPGAIHTLLQAEGEKRGIDCFSFWCHCPYYLQAAGHSGLMADLGGLLAVLGEFDLDMEPLEAEWRRVERKIGDLVENNDDLKAAIREVKKTRLQGPREPAAADKGGEVIDLAEFLKGDG